MKNLSIKIKLIIIFILIKIFPLLLIAYIAYEGVQKLNYYLTDSTKFLYNQSKEIILNTANASIEDSIKNLDKKSQISLEKVSFEIAKNVASFLYERDNDILFLSKLDLNEKVLKNFYSSKKRDIILHDKYFYDDKTSTWKTNENIEKVRNEDVKSLIKDNEKEFNVVNPLNYNKKSIPIYKEIAFFDLTGKEKYKVSQINSTLQNISNKKNTYINSEDYFQEIQKLKKDEIYVSDVIGEYIPSKIVGPFTKERAQKAGIEFKPENYAYAGKENPVGKEFEGIIRFITPVFKNGNKIGFVSLALDHKHIMQFTDTANPTGINPVQNISDASSGNYAFMWDYEGKNISHPRDYFIVGYDKNTGKRVMPWLSSDLAENFEKSNKNINDFLLDYPKFQEQSLNKKPNIKQLKESGNIALDCRYLNFAPQCSGWMQVTQNGGYGSFIIYWSKVWKLTTAASIPYYTGKFKNSKRGFGFITIGANVEEFHSAANETKNDVIKILKNQTENMKEIVNENKIEIDAFIKSLINELTVITFVMIILIVVIALLMSGYLSNKIDNILIGTKKFANNELDYRIRVNSTDEIGQLETSFNEMAEKIDNLLKEEKNQNENLEKRVLEEVLKQKKQEQILIQQTKLAAMGEMISNIAHQWRQPLNALGLVMQNLKFSYDMGELDDKIMDRSITKANLLTSNMSKTIDDFRNFFKPNKLKDLFNINDTILKAVNLVESTFEHNKIEIIKDLHTDEINILGFSNEFSQVILNILSNSKDALIFNEIKDSKVIIKSYINNENIFITIEDNALGIPMDIIDKIFDPYFTTKEEGKGTGIGLYMSKIIIESNMNGKITAENRDNGSMFTIKIPIK